MFLLRWFVGVLFVVALVRSGSFFLAAVLRWPHEYSDSPDCIAVGRVVGLSDAPSSQKPVVGTITIDRYDYGYVAYNAGGQQVFVTKAVPPVGTTVVATVTFSGVNSQGTPLPDFSVAFDVNGPEDTNPATHFGVVDDFLVRDKIGYPVPEDGGQTIPLQ